MYNLHLSPEQLEIRDTVRDFVRREIKPFALRADRLEAREKPSAVDALDQASRMGLRTLALAEDNGGAGADSLTCCIVAEERRGRRPRLRNRARPDRNACPSAVRPLDDADQRDRFLPQFLADDRYHLALAASRSDDVHSASTTTDRKSRDRPLDDRDTFRRRVRRERPQRSRRQRAARELFAARCALVARDRGRQTLLVPRDTARVASPRTIN